MPKISRPVVYTAVAAVAAYAVVLNTQPDAPTARRVVSASRSTPAASDLGGILPQDLSAHFPRYTGGARDPFTPGVVLARPNRVAAAPPSPFGTAQAGWALTGINSVNGVASALLENGATGESVFVQPGDRWNGLRVVAIKSDRVVFLNTLGHQDALTFAQPADDGTGAAATPAAPRLPVAALSLPPYPVAPLPVTPLAADQSQTPLPVLPPLSSADQVPPSGDQAPDDATPPPVPPEGQQ